MVKMFSRVLFFLCLTFYFNGCPSIQPAETRFEIMVANQKVAMRLAVTEAEQSKGLMHVSDLPENEGMIFLRETPGQASFWMKNTPKALDIGFFDTSGTLLEVRRMWPYEERITSSTSDQVRFCLEMNHNWFSDKGLKPGEKLDLAALKSAVSRRGFTPAAFGL